MLQKISTATQQFAGPQNSTRILLSNIENNHYSVFNQFHTYDYVKSQSRLYIGETLNVIDNMAIDFLRVEYANLLMIGWDTEKARGMFTFAVLSLCINYWIANHSVPDKPFIYLFNCKPLDDDYFKDTLKLLADLLPHYISYVPCGDAGDILTVVSELYKSVNVPKINDQYFFVFGYQRAEELKLRNNPSDDEEFNLHKRNGISLSVENMFKDILKNGAQNGIHSILWQDSFSAMEKDYNDVISYFSMRIAFDMTADEYSRFVSENDISLMSKNNAIYYSRTRDNQRFRPYQTPDEDWLTSICDRLEYKNERPEL